MHKLIALAALALAMSGAYAQNKAPTAQQTKMAQCNAEAGDKKGDERKAFMKSCLTNKQKAQQEKMKSCNADASAKSLKGADRRKFMSDCLKG